MIANDKKDWMNTYATKVLINHHGDTLKEGLTKSYVHHIGSDASLTLNKLSIKLDEQVMPKLCQDLKQYRRLSPRTLQN